MVDILIGNPITVTVNLATPSVPILLATGIVVLQDNGVTIGTQAIVPLPSIGPNVSGTVFMLDSTVLGVGMHELIVYYAGDSNFPATSFTSSDLQKNIVCETNTTSTLHTSLNPINFGEPTTLTFTISANGSITDHTAQVQLYVNDVPAGIPINTVPTAKGAIASISTSDFVFGTNTVYGVFSSGSGAYSTSTSNTVTQTLNLLNPTIMLQSLSNPSMFHNSVTFIATMAGAVGSPTGAVTFYNGNSIIGSPVGLSGGITTITVSNLAGGAHAITAVYGGSTSYTPVTSMPLTQLVNSATTNTSFTTDQADTSLNVYQCNEYTKVAFTAAVSSSGGTPNGNVTFVDTGVLHLFPPGGITVVLDDTGTAQTTQYLIPPGTQAGTYTLVANYSGNSNFTISSSPTITLNIIAD